MWEGTGAGQGQIRLRGALIPAQHRNTHQLREAHAVRSQQAFDEREKGGRHHLPEGAERRQRRDKIRLGIPRWDVLQERDADRGDSSIDMYNNDVGKESAQKFMKQTGDLKAATLYFAS